ncbi:MAG: response regulator [Candidatus Kapaibacterium sp.]
MPEDKNKATKSAPKGNLLIVDDEEAFLKILEKLFGKHYNIRTATSGPKALEILNSGFHPGVILSDQRMPEMTGSEFLEKSIKIYPEAVRIILTGYTNPRDIISCINQGHTYMYLTKPSEDLELIQAIRIAFDHYYNTRKRKELITQLNQKIRELNEKNDRLKKLYVENKSSESQTVQAIAEIIRQAENIYFTPHTNTVTLIAKSLAEELEYSPAQIPLVVFASLIHNISIVGMPEDIKYLDILDLTSKEHEEKYIEYFKKNVTALAKIPALDKYVRIVAQIWERQDGSGYPMGLSGSQLSKEAQFIAFGNMYHNHVYCLSEEQMEAARKHGYVKQSAGETREKHEETIKLLYRKANWFDMDVFNAFHSLVRKKTCAALVPSDQDIVYRMETALTEPPEPEAEEEQPEQKEMPEPETEGADSPFGEDGPRMIDKDIDIDQLEAGMTIGQNVVTKKGMLIVRQDATLQPAIVNQIKRLAETGEIKGPLTITVSSDKT